MDAGIQGFKNGELGSFGKKAAGGQLPAFKLGLFCKIMFFATEGTEGYEGIKLASFGFLTGFTG